MTILPTPYVPLAAVLTLLLACQAQAQQPPERTPSKTLAYPKLVSQLSDLVEQAVSDPDRASELAGHAPLSEGDAVAVTIHLDGNPAPVLGFLTHHNVEPANLRPDLIEAYVPLLRLPGLSEYASVERVALIHPPRPQQR